MVRKAENKARGRACQKINLTGASAFVVVFSAPLFLLDNATGREGGGSSLFVAEARERARCSP